MSYGYSTDLRKKVLDYIDEGHSQSNASKTFKISRKTIYNWMQLRRTGNYALSREHKRKPRKIDHEKIKDYIKKHPDAYLQEIAQEFGLSINGVWSACKRLNITRKKRQHCIASAKRMKEKRTKRN